MKKQMRLIGIALAMTLLLPGMLPAHSAAPPAQGTVDTSEVRTITPLMEGWKFQFNQNLSDEEALEATGADWEVVALPHTWNNIDAASLESEGYQRGRGWYLLEFPSPAEGSRHWLEFGAASLVTDVWLNGEHLGQHKGAFTAFRFDITNELIASGMNDLLVKVDTNEPPNPDYITAIAPLGGDFNISGGLYRYVQLISTRDPVHFALSDLGSSGVYATTTDLTNESATVDVLAKMRSDSDQAGNYTTRFSLLDAEGVLAASQEQVVALEPRGQADVAAELVVANPHRWHGVQYPYLYTLVVELLNADGTPIDKVMHSYGIREMRFDPEEGFFLNGEPMRLNGVAIHQDFLHKGWALSTADWDTNYNLIMEVGANAVRFGHYPFPAYALEKANQLGLVVWSEAVLGLGTTVGSCTGEPPTEEYIENAKLQLEEMIRQQFNHASVAAWSIGNETSARSLRCEEGLDTVTSVLQEMHDLAKELDPNRPTVYAEFGHPVERTGPFATEGITDLFATNRYFLWYTEGIEGLGEILDGLHELTPDQPLGVSEYGAGGAISHHTDNPLGGMPDIRSAPEGQTSYQPEEYQAYVHEQDYRVLTSKDYLWGTFVWNMFDFGSAHRNEGDVLGVNTKGLVTFDRQTRKDAFFFYKANWSSAPTTYITSRRYVDRAYAINDIKVYSNADSVQLSVNGTVVGRMTAEQCEFRTCVFEDVQLSVGANTVTAVGTHADGQTSTDEVTWNLANEDVNISAGSVTSGFISADNERFGSDKFYVGGSFPDPGEAPTPEDLIGEEQTPGVGQLYRHYRQGEFRYEIPLDNGSYEVRLGFVEPFEETEEGERVFDVTANGETVLDDFDPLVEAGDYLQVTTESFTVEVTNGLLTLEFTPSEGDAIVSTIMVRASEGQ